MKFNFILAVYPMIVGLALKLDNVYTSGLFCLKLD